MTQKTITYTPVQIQQQDIADWKLESLDGVSFYGRDVAEQVWGRLPYDSLFCYLFRRFGPPMTPSDDYKDLCSYILSTPDPEIYVLIRLASYGFVTLTAMTTSNDFRRIATREYFDSRIDMEILPDESTPNRRRIFNAFRALVENLLLPVGIRDTALNCLGEYTGEENEIEAYQYAGHPCQPELS